MKIENLQSKKEKSNKYMLSPLSFVDCKEKTLSIINLIENTKLDSKGDKEFATNIVDNL